MKNAIVCKTTSEIYKNQFKYVEMFTFEHLLLIRVFGFLAHIIFNGVWRIEIVHETTVYDYGNSEVFELNSLIIRRCKRKRIQTDYKTNEKLLFCWRLNVWQMHR